MTPHRRPEPQRPGSGMMSLLLVTSAMSSLTCMASRSSSPFNPKRKPPVNPPLDFRPHYNQIYQVEKLKDKILRGLNLTQEPKPPTKKPPQPVHSVLNRLPPPRNRTHTLSSVPDTIVWSESAEAASLKKADQILFRVGSQKAKSSIINRVTLLVRLRFTRNSSPKGKKGKAKGRKGTRGKGKGKGNRLPEVKDQGMQNDEPRKSRDRNKSGSKQKKKKKSGKKRKKARRVKLLVQALHGRTGKFKRVVVQRVTVSKKFTWIKIPIPVSLVSRATRSANQSLVLRIRCRRCVKTGVSIDSAMPRKKARKTGDDSGSFLNLNPNRPYMVICTADNPLTTPSPASLTRSARHVDKVCSSQSVPAFSCCSEELEVTFKDLGWHHWIVHPHGFITHICQPCQSSAAKHQSLLHHENGLSASERGRKAKEDSVAFVRQRHGDKTAKNEDSDVRSTDWRHSESCRPRDSSSLTVMYYTDRNTLVRATIPRLIVSSCVCSPRQ